MNWIKKKFFTNLDQEFQKNHLLLLILTLSYVLGVANQLFNVGLDLKTEDILFFISGLGIIILGIILLKIPKAISLFKYIMSLCLLLLSIGIIYLLPSTATFHMIYFTLVVCLIYFHEKLVLFIGVLAITYTLSAWFFAKDLFFPRALDTELDGYILLLLLVTMATWGVARVGKSLISRLQVEREEMNVIASRLQESQRFIEQTVLDLGQDFITLSINITTSTQSTEELKNAFQEIATGNSNQAESMSRTVDQLNGMEETIQQLIDQIKEASNSLDQSIESSNISITSIHQFAKQMESLNHVIDESSKVIKELASQSKRINEIVEVITGISNQTSLLALNANIEAARAGEHGRGFTVVANEVLKLADESHESAGRIQEILKEFSQQTEKVENQVEKGEEIKRQSNELLNQVLSNVNNVGEFMTSLDRLMEDFTAHQEAFQQRTIHIVQEVTHAASVTEQTSAATEEVLASAEEETARMKKSIRALDSVNQGVNQLAEIFKK